MALALPRPRDPLLAAGPAARQWYEQALGWPTAGGEPLRLRTGIRFDVLEMPADAGFATLRRAGRTGPVALGRSQGRPYSSQEPGEPVLRLLVATGAADELPGVLEWLEWGSVGLELTALGSGDLMPAPPPVAPWTPAAREATAPVPAAGPGLPAGVGPWGAAWVRPPEPGCDVEATLPSTGSGAGLGGGGGVPRTSRMGRAPDLVRLVSVAATECHRARLLRVRKGRTDRFRGDQPLAFSYASRTVAGTRPRSLTS
ncbi:SCO3374 family protein [Streptomyces ochraceiscleroticus]|uniref:SCO3374 family protein n=1 Tax=Streptomyces ochraceiscleroticus TaxID=47761 RepID=A0ABW1MMR4_9ACTN|nr:SCO3374 family protein [Streptomyces ochraceiscleroticus]